MKKLGVLFLGAILVVSVVFSGCSASGGDSTMSSAAADSAQNTAGYESEAAVEEAGGAMADTGAGTSLTVPADNRKIIRDARVAIKSAELDSTVSAIQDSVKSSGGYISSSSRDGSGGTGSKYGNLTCRIPADKYDSFMESLSGTGEILSMNESTEDVTADYIDVEAKIKSLKAQEERLYELLDKAGSLESLIAIQNQLSEVQYQIDSYTGRLNQMKGLISYCTVNIDISQEVAAITPVEDSFGSRIGAAFQNMWNGLINGSQSFVIFFIYAIPVVVIGLVVLAVVLISVRYVRKKKNK